MSLEMRGLANFIQDIRAATNNREKEQQRIELELGKIRAKFKNSTELSAYDRKKYVCKLMFIFMLGYPVDFGHMEGVNLLSGQTASEKLIGYLSVAVFLHENHELLTLTTHTIHLDLVSGKELNMCLALGAIANIGGPDFAEAMAPSVQKIVATTTSALVLKKSLLTLVRLFRKYPEAIQLEDTIPVVVKLLSNEDMGVSCCAMSVINAFIGHCDMALMADVPRHCIAVMGRIILDKLTPGDYIYYGVPAPWLQMKAIRLLQHFPLPEDERQRSNILVILQKIVRATDKVLKEAQTTANKPKGTYNRCNAMNSVLVEVVSLIIQYDCDERLLRDCAEILATFIADKKEPNTRYLGLALMSRMSFCSATAFDFSQQIQQFQAQVVVSLHDADISVRQKALELLYFMCNRSNADEIVGELLSYLTVSDGGFREELVLMVAILAEKFCSDLSWYFEIILSMVTSAGDHVSEDIWQRACHIVVNTPAIQKRAAETVFRAVSVAGCHELVVKVAAFVLGEFGYQIALSPDTSPAAQVAALSAKFSGVSDDTKCMLLTTYAKFYNLYDNAAVRQKLLRLVQGARSSLNVEVQQRAKEYAALLEAVSDETLQAVLEPMPVFELEGNALLGRLKEKRRGTDRNIWAEKQELSEEAARRAQQASFQPEGFAEEATAAAPSSSSLSSSAAPLPKRQQDAEPATATHVDPTTAAPAAPRSGIDAILFGETEVPTARATVAGGGAATTASVAAAPPQSTAAATSSSLLDDIFAITTPSETPTQTATRAAEGFFKRLRISSSGVLYQDDILEISAQHEYRAADGRMTLTFHNRSATATLEHLATQLTSVSSSLIVQFKPMPTSTVAPNEKVQLLCAARSTAVFAEPPVLQVSYAIAPSGAQATSRVKLPIVTTRFVEPYKVADASKFDGLWGSTTAGDPALADPGFRIALSKAIDIVALEAFMFQRMRFFTIRATASAILAVGAHACHPRDAPEYTPVLVRAELAPGGECVQVSVKNASAPLQHCVAEVIREELPLAV